MTMTAVEADGARDAPLERVGRLFDRQHRRIYRLARRMTRDPEAARDLLQETFLRAAARAKSLPAEEAAAEAWLVRTTVNLCRDRGRRLTVRKRDRHKIDRPTRSRDDPEAATVARASVETALARLAPKRRAVIVLVELEELSTREVAGLLGIAEATVRWHLSKGRKELRTVLERELAHPSIRRPREGDDPR
ncbi:MAG: RNA polymerase sigma factor [Thermoanaerobaculia bacterium]|nr:RNA polymerase sigma factor [Thermoanaerobaculia bacterium]